MTGLWTLSKREFLGYFYAPIAYVVGTAFLAVNGFAFWAILKALSDPKQPAEPGAVLRHFFGGTLVHWLTVFAVIALLSMRSVAEDRRSGNWEALLTTRIGATTVILAKWFALVAFYVLLWLLTLVLLPVFFHYLPTGQSLDLGPVASSYLALFAIGAALLAIGVVISATTDNQIVAAVVTFALSLVWLMVGEVSGLRGDEHHASSSWFVLVDLRESLALAARGEVRLGFYVRELVLIVVALCAGAGLATRQRARRLVLIVASVLLLMGGSSLAVLVDRHCDPHDWSASHLNSLEASTEAVLAAIDQPVELILVQPTEEVFDSVHGEVSRLLDRMGRAQPLIERRSLDPLESPTRVQEWAFELAISPDDLSSGGAVIVKQGGRQRVVDLLAMASFAADDLGVGSLSELRAEAAITQALSMVIHQKHERLCASAGHGELAARSDGSPSHQHWQAALSRLEEHGVELELLWVLDAAGLSHCDSLILMGPSTALLPEEILAVDTYLRAGGNALIALRSRPEDANVMHRDSGLRLLLEKRGMQVLDALVVDPDNEPASSPDWMTYDGYGDHAIVRDFQGRRATIWSAPLALQSSQGDVVSLVQASSSAWAERDIASLIDKGVRVKDQEDVEQVQVALAQTGPNASRLVLVGSAESLSSLWSERGVAGNERFLVSALLWTLGREVQLAKESKKPEHLRLLMTANDLHWAFFWCVVAGPLFFALLGALLALLRSREKAP